MGAEWLSWVESFEDPYWGFLDQLVAKNLQDLFRLSLPHGQPETGRVGLEEGRDGMGWEELGRVGLLSGISLIIGPGARTEVLGSEIWGNGHFWAGWAPGL